MRKGADNSSFKKVKGHEQALHKRGYPHGGGGGGGHNTYENVSSHLLPENEDENRSKIPLRTSPEWLKCK